MASLSGDYDVAIEVGVNVLNGILGAVHENQDPKFPTMPRSLNLFVDDTPHGPADPVPEQERTGIASRVEVEVSTPTISLPLPVLEVRPEDGGLIALRAGARPGTSEPPLPVPPLPVPSPPETPPPVPPSEPSPGGPVPPIHLPPTNFRVPKVTAQVRVRAWIRDPTDGRLPEFVDGDLFTTTAVLRSDVSGVGSFVTLDRTTGPLVTFQPAAGTDLTEPQRQAISSIVRNVIRGDTEPMTFKVSLPQQVKQFDFALQPEARRPSILLMFTLTDRTLGPGATDSVAAGFLPDGTDFAVAVGRDFVLSTVRSQLFQALPSEFRFSKLRVSVTVRPDLATAAFDLQPGRIVFSLAGAGDISWFGVDDHFTFSVHQDFTLQVVQGSLVPVADGDPVVDLSDVVVGSGFIEAGARDRIKEERDVALAAGTSTFRDAFDVQGEIESILSGINPSPAGVTLSGVEIRPEGVLVSGTIGLAASGPVTVAQVGRSGLHDALDSVIPGGTIDRFVFERTPAFPGPSVRVEDHRFVTESLEVSVLGSLCVTIQGTRVVAGGGVVPVSASACFRFSPVIGPVIGLAPDRPRPLLPLTEPDGAGGLRVLGHFDPWAPGRAPAGGHANLLVHFGSPDDEDAPGMVREAMAAERERDIAVLSLTVGPNGTGWATQGRGDLLVVEDQDAAWAEAFGVSSVPATMLLGPSGETLWETDSPCSREELATAIDSHAKDGGEVAITPIRLAVGTGQRPPDVPLHLVDGSELSLRRLTGRPVVLCFWTSRSGPSMDQLEYLRAVQAADGDKGPIVIAIGDGEDSQLISDLLDERRYPFLVLPDKDRLVSRAFGVFCWPATVWIRPDQRIEAIDFGLSPGIAVRG